MKIKFKVLKHLSPLDWLYKLSISIIANRLVHGQNLLTPEYLIKRGWISDGEFFVEPNIKLRDKLWIRFEDHWFTIYRGEARTFIGLESKIEWFEIYWLLVHSDNGRYELSGI